MLSVRPSTHEEFDEREIPRDPALHLSAVNSAGGLIGVAVAETHEVVWYSPQADRAAVDRAIQEHKSDS
jgi:hypothetical protein